MQLVYRNHSPNVIHSALLPKSVKRAMAYAFQAAVVVLAVIGAFYLAEAVLPQASSAVVGAPAEKPAYADPASEFVYFPDAFVNQGTLPEQPIAQF